MCLKISAGSWHIAHINFACGDADGGDMIETASGGQTCGRNCVVQSDDISSGDVAPDWRPVNCVVVPYDRVDEQYQTSKSRPHHVSAHPGVPS